MRGSPQNEHVGRRRKLEGETGNWLGAKLGGKLKSSFVELLSRRNVGAVSWSNAETEENPGEVMTIQRQLRGRGGQL